MNGTELQNDTEMNVGFTSSNLNATVNALMAQVAGHQKTIYIQATSGSQSYSLEDPEQVREYLMSAVIKIHRERGAGVGGQIMGVVYRTIGVAFERVQGDGGHLIFTGPGLPTHQAVFWQALETRSGA